MRKQDLFRKLEEDEMEIKKPELKKAEEKGLKDADPEDKDAILSLVLKGKIKNPGPGEEVDAMRIKVEEIDQLASLKAMWKKPNFGLRWDK